MTGRLPGLLGGPVPASARGTAGFAGLGRAGI